MNIFKPKAISKCPDCGWSSESYADFLEHRVKCLRSKVTPAIPSWDTLEEDVGWACDKVYKDSHK